MLDDGQIPAHFELTGGLPALIEALREAKSGEIWALAKDAKTQTDTTATETTARAVTAPRRKLKLENGRRL
jgi:hypothetical protein